MSETCAIGIDVGGTKLAFADIKFTYAKRRKGINIYVQK